MKYLKPGKSNSLFPTTGFIETYMALRRTHDAVHCHVSKKLAKWNLSVPKYGVLVRLYDHEPLMISCLSSQIFRANSNMTTLITRMERDGLVCRYNHGGDRRVQKIALTSKGRRLARKVIGQYKPFLHEMMTNALSSEEQKQLLELLIRVRESLQP